MFWGIIVYVLIILTLLFLLGCYYVKKIQWYFDANNIKYSKTTLPCFGNNIPLRVVTELLKDLYDSFPNEKYTGFVNGYKPSLFLRDLELLKQIGIKEFDIFHDRSAFFDEDMDIFGKTLVMLRGNKWRDMRATLSPAFSSSKMRNMFIFIEKCSKSVSEFYIQQFEKQGEDVFEIEAKEVFSKYTIDSISTTAFGFETNSFLDTQNDFYKMSKVITSFNIIQLLKIIGFVAFPMMMKKLGITMFSQRVETFFTQLINSTMKMREERNIIRPDMIHLLMEAKKGALVHESSHDDKDTGFATVEESTVGRKAVKRDWPDEFLTAQAFIFFAGGFETVSGLISFFFYEIAKQPELQKKLQDEIDSLRSESEDKIDYNDLQKLKYLDMCVSEALRMWPPLPAIDRICSKSYKLPSPTNGSTGFFELEKDIPVIIPIYAIQNDPINFPNPEKFDPERFSDENKKNIKPNSYIPFGIGPRNCIGSRYALMVAKAIIFQMMAKFDIVVTKHTEIPLRITNNGVFGIKSKNGIKIGLKKRAVI